MIKVGITGGIGSGKSRLCKLFSSNGIPHYDTDSKAKELMHQNEEIREQIIKIFGEESYVSGMLNREYLASKIFCDERLREKLNSIVHPAVRADFDKWCEKQGDAPYVVMESALLFNADLHKKVDVSLAVVAPEKLRIERVVARDGVSEEQVRARIASQMCDDEFHKRADITVANIFDEDLEGSIQRLDQIFKKMAYDRATK